MSRSEAGITRIYVISERYRLTNLLGVLWLSRKLIIVSGTIKKWTLKELLLE
jgi:hypothetical protein